MWSSIKCCLMGCLFLYTFGTLRCNSQEYYWLPYRSQESGYSTDGEIKAIQPAERYIRAYASDAVTSGAYYDYRYSANPYSENDFLSPASESDGSPYHEERIYYDYDAPLQELRDQRHHSREKDKEILEKMNALDRILSDDERTADKEVEWKNSINEKIISDVVIPEEAKRAVRQVRKQKPGFFWTLVRLAFETYNDTQSAIKQISDIVSSNIAPDTTTQQPVTSNSLTDMKGAPSSNQNQVSDNRTTVNSDAATTTASTTTTTEGPYKITRSELQSLIRRNVKGLIRLFNIEWQDAVKQSDVSVKEFQKDLSKQVGSYLRDNPDNY